VKKWQNFETMYGSNMYAAYAVHRILKSNLIFYT
jgi:hypothetical protein